MSCRGLVLRHLEQLAPGELFTTRDLLGYGRRNAVDKTTHYLVKQGYISRLAYGVFVVTHTSRESYTAAEIAECKARAFGKTAYVNGKNLISLRRASGFDLDAGPIGKDRADYPGLDSYLFSATSSSSQFAARVGAVDEGGGLIRVRYCCAKLLRHKDSKVGRAIRAFVAKGRLALDRMQLEMTLGQFSPRELMELRMANAWMPYWLSNQLITEQSAVLSALRFSAERKRAKEARAEGAA